MTSSEWGWNENSLPDDISLKITAFLQLQDVCTLGSCSRFWREFCASDSIWRSLYTQRWPSLKQSPTPIITENSDTTQHQLSSAKEWRSFYIERHSEMAHKATYVIKFVNQSCRSESLEVVDYQRAIADLFVMEFGFKDIEMFLFASKQSALLNLIGLYYLIFWLHLPATNVMQVLLSCHVSERQVCVKWWKLGRWSHGYRLRDEAHSRNVSLGDLASAKENEVLEVLHRGAIHEVLRVQISAPSTAYTPWTLQNMHHRSG